MPITRNIDVMLSRPGMYVVITLAALTVVEVDDDGRCHQCTLTDHRRDGELRPGGWYISQITSIVGPFARAAC